MLRKVTLFPPANFINRPVLLIKEYLRFTFAQMNLINAEIALTMFCVIKALFMVKCLRNVLYLLSNSNRLFQKITGMKYTDLHSQFRSIDYTVFIRKRNSFRTKPTRAVVTRSRGGEIVKIKVNKAMSGILSFIRILYLKRQNNFFGVFTV